MVKVDHIGEQTGNTSVASALVLQQYMRCTDLTDLWHILPVLDSLVAIPLLQISNEPFINNGELATLFITSASQLAAASLHSRHHCIEREEITKIE